MIDDQYTEWDAAYVLGALSSSDRHEYEEHLARCEACSAAVSQLAVMPGLLAALPQEDALAMLDDEASTAGPIAPLPEILPLLAARVRRTRRRRLALAVSGAAAAAAIVVAAIVVPSLPGRSAPTSEVVLRPSVPSALTATVGFTSERWGTSIRMDCQYEGPAEGSGSADASSWKYGLYVTDRSGSTTRVSTWTADPGSDVLTTGSIDLALTDLSRVEVRSESSGAVLLARTLP